MAEKLSETDAKAIQPLVLAMIGDSVQTLFVREQIALRFGVKVNRMSKMVSTVCSAGAQFLTFKEIEETLNEDEKSVALRARNANIHTKSKNFSYGEYIYATALEAVIGYLHLTGSEKRLNEILEISMKRLREE